NRGRAVQPRVDLTAADEVLEGAAIATQSFREKERQLVKDPDLIALARAAHDAIPEVPLKGCDILRDVDSGALYVLEVNPGGNTWHFSSDHLARVRSVSGAEFERPRARRVAALGDGAPGGGGVAPGRGLKPRLPPLGPPRAGHIPLPLLAPGGPSNFPAPG